MASYVISSDLTIHWYDTAFIFPVSTKFLSNAWDITSVNPSATFLWIRTKQVSEITRSRKKSLAAVMYSIVHFSEVHKTLEITWNKFLLSVKIWTSVDLPNNFLSFCERKTPRSKISLNAITSTEITGVVIRLDYYDLKEIGATFPPLSPRNKIYPNYEDKSALLASLGLKNLTNFKDCWLSHRILSLTLLLTAYLIALLIPRTIKPFCSSNILSVTFLSWKVSNKQSSREFDNQASFMRIDRERLYDAHIGRSSTLFM